jgi:hypothetical protein
MWDNHPMTKVKSVHSTKVTSQSQDSKEGGSRGNNAPAAEAIAHVRVEKDDSPDVPARKRLY